MKYTINYKRLSFFLWIFIALILVSIIGINMNFRVMMVNGGKMPVLSSYKWESQGHFSYVDGEEIEYRIFSDIISIGDKMWSIGDFTMIFAFGSSIVLLGFMFSKRFGPYEKV